MDRYISKYEMNKDSSNRNTLIIYLDKVRQAPLEASVSPSPSWLGFSVHLDIQCRLASGLGTQDLCYELIGERVCKEVTNSRLPPLPSLTGVGDERELSAPSSGAQTPSIVALQS